MIARTRLLLKRGTRFSLFEEKTLSLSLSLSQPPPPVFPNSADALTNVDASANLFPALICAAAAALREGGC